MCRNPGIASGSTTAKPKASIRHIPWVDVTADLPAGENTVTIRVSSSLNNRLLARGYYDIVAGWSDPNAMQTTEVHDHGLLGPVRLLRISEEG